MLVVRNEDFLKTLFGEEWEQAHVTAFPDDPTDIPNERRAECWGGGEAGKRVRFFNESDNQYFTISLFHKFEGRAVRRKGQFDACFVIVADDVAEKLPQERAEKLPKPTYKLLTSAGSQQWGWVLASACTDADKVNNLLDGLIAKGLSPDGVDPGMKGVTRYVRLPEGSNTKAKRWVEGKPFKCQMLEWNPRLSYEIETLGQVFDIDLNAPRHEVAGAGLSSDDPIVRNHPVLKHLTITGVGNDGWLRVDCPNVANHSDNDPSGAAVQVQEDGRVHFQCHHGHCSGESKDAKKLTGKRMVKLLDDQKFNGSGDLIRDYDTYCKITNAKRKIDAFNKIKDKLDAKKSEFVLEGEFIGADEVEDIEEETFFNPLRYIYIAPADRFYDTERKTLLTRNALDSRYMSILPRGRGLTMAAETFLLAIDRKRCEADGVSWFPTGTEKPCRDELIKEINGQRMINTWTGFALKPQTGDVSLWLDHAEYLIPDAREREVVLDYLACMVQRIDKKPAFFIGHRGTHRTGKDLLYKPFMQALGHDIARAVEIDNILNGWGDYVNELKFVIVTEVDKAQDKKVANSMKTISAPTASGYRILNLKGRGVVSQLDCMGGVMMSNKRHFIAIEKGDRRYFIIDSWVEPKDAEYYARIDKWYSQKGTYEAILGYLMSRDISHFNHNQLPYMTKGAQEMVEAGRYDYEQDIEEMIREKTPPFHMPWVLPKELKKLRKEHDLKCGNNGLNDALLSFGWGKFRGLKKINGVVKTTPTFYTDQLPPDAVGNEPYEFFEQNPRKPIEVTKTA